jgi:TonB family protein
MASISTQSIFQSSASEKSMSDKTWRSYVGSIVVHGVLLLLALTITIPVMHPVQRATEHVTLIAPVLSEFKPKITAPVPVHRTPAPVVPTVLRPAPIPPKPLEVTVPKPAPPKPPVIAAAPEIKEIPPAPVDVKPELPAVPKPTVQTGVFKQAVDLAKNRPTPKVEVGGFGDPNGASLSANVKMSMLPKVGAFDAPNGSGTNGGSGRGQAGVVKQGAFGSAAIAGQDGNAHAADAVKAAGFGDAAAAQVRKKSTDPNGSQAFTPVEVLSKPRPAYTAEARNLRLEGHVSLEVIFLSTGSVRVVRVIHGLGHGLDEAAEQAAMQVRFKPAMRGGVPVDTDATIDITFELT